jgi:hypothetical protein
VTLSTLQGRAEDLRPQLKELGLLGVPTLLSTLQQTPDTTLPSALALAIDELPSFPDRSQAYLAILAWRSRADLGDPNGAVAIPGSDEDVTRVQSALAAEHWSEQVQRQYFPTLVQLLESRQELLERLPLEQLSTELLRLARQAFEFNQSHEKLMTQIEELAEKLPSIPEASSMRDRLIEVREHAHSDLIERALIVSRLRAIQRQLLGLQQSWQDEVAQLESERAQLEVMAP